MRFRDNVLTKKIHDSVENSGRYNHTNNPVDSHQRTKGNSRRLHATFQLIYTLFFGLSDNSPLTSKSADKWHSTPVKEIKMLYLK